MKLIKYRDAGMHTYTYFWMLNDRVVSDYFDTPEDAAEWYQREMDKWLENGIQRENVPDLSNGS